jgi:hypothetical protein
MSIAIPVLSFLAAAALCCAIYNYRRIRVMTEEIQRLRESQSDLERDSDCRLFEMVTRSFDEKDKAKENEINALKQTDRLISSLCERVTALEGKQPEVTVKTK